MLSSTTYILSALPHRSPCARHTSPWLFSLCVSRRRVGLLCTAGTHGGHGNSTHPSHLTMQARWQRVPDSCDDHTTPLARPHIGFYASASHQLLVRSCDSAHHFLYCPYVWAHTHHNSLQHLPHPCLSSLIFSSRMEENSRMCSRPTALHGGITLSTRVFRSSHHTLSNSYKLVRAPRRPLAPTQESNGTTSSDFVYSPQLPHSAISPQVQTGSTRTATSDLMSATPRPPRQELPGHPRSYADFSAQRCFC